MTIFSTAAAKNAVASVPFPNCVEVVVATVIDRMVNFGCAATATAPASWTVACRVVRIAGRSGIRTIQVHEVPEAGIGVRGRESARIDDRDEFVVGVVTELRNTAGRIGDLTQPIERIVSFGGIPVQRSRNRTLVTIVIVPIGRSDGRSTGRVDILVELVQGIEYSGVHSVQNPIGVKGIFCNPITHRSNV
jgi:hypothetical protein